MSQREYTVTGERHCDCWQTPLIVLTLILSRPVLLAQTLCPTLLVLSSTVNILQYYPNLSV